ncbi:MAG: hypothetical protein DWQ34_12020 [Planctomycetota bacterium]|nr:MAG: hypothetical protein DWQ34_12020 [Planctomycetota bacterium]REK26151.1 MAG: hypothetical protein DWQ41_10875 [Planctomycetota bacterium]REK33520.1 MAG: hypothetical protein DWQ45_15140 [Planctomycetota bacterium]
MSSLVRLTASFAMSIVLLALPAVVEAGGALEAVREEVRDSSRNEDDDDDWGDHWDDDCDDEPSVFGAMIGEIFGPPILYTVSSPWWGPHTALNDQWGFRAEFADAPYSDHHNGYLLINSPGAGRSVAGRFSTEYGNDLSGLSRVGTRLLVDTSSRIGFDAEWSQWTEEVRGGHDSLSTGDFNAILRFAQSERVQFRSGIGFNWLADSHDSDFGVNLTYGVDLFPARPWVVSSTFDCGTLGDAVLFRARGSVGVVWKCAELFTGYDYQRFGSADLHGPIIGLRLWY